MPALPMLDRDALFVTDGGLETTLIFEQGVDLPDFASFPLVEDDDGRALLRAYFAPYVAVAREHGLGFIADTATWRASADWGDRLGYDAAALDRVNRAAVALAQEIADDLRGDVPVAVAGTMGPRGDGYVIDERMSPGEAQAYHAAQVRTFAQAGVDLVSAMTMTYADEATGIVRAALAEDVPAVISFTVETDGRLPDGTALADAIEQVDADTGAAAAYFMVNCAHPTHVTPALAGDGGAWRERIRGLRPNASTLSHAELDEADHLDAGDPADLGRRWAALREQVPSLGIMGGCCGTSAVHVGAICAAVVRA